MLWPLWFSFTPHTGPRLTGCKQDFNLLSKSFGFVFFLFVNLLIVFSQLWSEHMDMWIVSLLNTEQHFLEIIFIGFYLKRSPGMLQCIDTVEPSVHLRSKPNLLTLSALALVQLEMGAYFRRVSFAISLIRVSLLLSDARGSSPPKSVSPGPSCNFLIAVTTRLQKGLKIRIRNSGESLHN